MLQLTSSQPTAQAFEAGGRPRRVRRYSLLALLLAAVTTLVVFSGPTGATEHEAAEHEATVLEVVEPETTEVSTGEPAEGSAPLFYESPSIYDIVDDLDIEQPNAITQQDGTFWCKPESPGEEITEAPLRFDDEGNPLPLCRFGIVGGLDRCPPDNVRCQELFDELTEFNRQDCEQTGYCQGNVAYFSSGHCYRDPNVLEASSVCRDDGLDDGYVFTTRSHLAPECQAERDRFAARGDSLLLITQDELADHPVADPRSRECRDAIIALWDARKAESEPS